MGIKYYDMDGKPMDMMAWAVMFEDHAKRRVGSTTVWPGWWVSTVLLGMDHSFHGGPPIIFETMVFHPKQSDVEMDRYSTKEEALAGHWAMVRRMRWQWWRFFWLWIHRRKW